MAAKTRFYWYNLLRFGTLTYSTQEPAYPASYAHHRFLSLRWRSDGIATGGEYLRLDMGAATQARGLIFAKTNFSAAMTGALWANASNTWDSTADIYPFAWNAPDCIGPDIKLFHLSANERWYTINLDDILNPDGYVEVGLCFLGNYLQPSRNFIRQSEKPFDASIAKLTEGGNTASVIRRKGRSRSYIYPALPQTDKDLFDEMFDYVGESRPFFFCEDKNEGSRNTVFYVKLTSFEWAPVVKGFWTLNLTMEDVA